MSFATVSGTVRLGALLVACTASLAVGLAGQFIWRLVSIRAIGVPAELVSLGYPALVLNTVVPALGNGLGYLLAYRRRSRMSVVMFVCPAVLLAGVGLTVSLGQLPASSGFTELAVSVVAGVITPIVAVAVLVKCV
ncbi:MAG: hypothetical protein ACOH2Q_13410 [Rhodococcus sp. (in: high G+C Gram-positive bacteria)]